MRGHDEEDDHPYPYRSRPRARHRGADRARSALRAGALSATGRPPLRRREGGFAGLAQIIMGQQLSTASAAAIYGRLVAIADPFDHHAVLRARKDRLLRVGLSNAKVKTLKEIAKAIDKKHVDLTRSPTSRPTRRMRRSSRCTASARGPPTSICSPASAMPTHGRRAISRCRRRRALAFGLPQAADHEGDGTARGKLAALARGRRAAAVELLSRHEKARRRAHSRPAAKPATPKRC